MTATTMPIVLVHGWAGSAEAWEPVVNRLRVEHDGHVIPLRLPGSPGSRTDLDPTISTAVDQLIEELSVLGRPAALIGHSMGAQVTTRAQVRMPTMIHAEIVIDPAYGADASTRAEMQAWADRITGVGHDEVLQFFASATDGLAESAREQIMADVLSTPPPVIARYLRSEYVDEDAIGLLPTTRSLLSHRTRPVLAIHSTTIGADRESTFDAPPGSRIDMWNGHGHYLHLQSPDRFVSTVTEWLRRV